MSWRCSWPVSWDSPTHASCTTFVYLLIHMWQFMPTLKVRIPSMHDWKDCKPSLFWAFHAWMCRSSVQTPHLTDEFHLETQIIFYIRKQIRSHLLTMNIFLLHLFIFVNAGFLKNSYNCSLFVDVSSQCIN